MTVKKRRNQRQVDVDKRVGLTIKALRVSQGLSQTTLADRLGVTFQQLQKYEEGVNRVSASRLYFLAEALSVRVQDLFDEVGKGTRTPKGEHAPVLDGLPMKRETIQLVRYASVIPSSSRRALIDFAKASQAMIETRGTSPQDRAKNGRRTRLA